MNNLILSFVQCFTNFFISFIFLNGFFQKRQKNIYINVCTVAVFSLLLAIANCYKVPFINATISLTLIGIMVFVLFKGKTLNLLLAGFSIDVIIIACEFIPVSIISAYIKADVYSVVNDTLDNVGFYFISTGVFFVITLIAKSVLYKFNFVKAPHTERLNPKLLPLPLLSLAIMYYVFLTSRLSKLNQEMVFFSIAIAGCLLSVNVIVFASDSDSRKKHQYRSQIAEMSLQREMHESLILQQDTSIQQTNALIHDFKNQLQTLKAIIAEYPIVNEQEKANNYICQALEGLPKMEPYTEITCPALRCILINTSYTCKRLGIAFTTQIEFCNFDFMTYQDICTVFSNALENATQACQEMCEHKLSASIALTIRRENHMVFINLRNDKINFIVEDQEGRIHTTKSDKFNHGIGIMNIRQAVEKNHGILQIMHTTNSFEISILLMNIPQFTTTST